VPLRDIPLVLSWGTLTRHLLPSAPDIQLGDKLTPDEPPRWTSWLESWYTAYDPLVWKVLEKDDEDDRRRKEELRAEGLRLIAVGTSERVLRTLEMEHFKLLMYRLLRRVRLYRASLVIRSLGATTINII
jgi:hypothetical protein